MTQHHHDGHDDHDGSGEEARVGAAFDRFTARLMDLDSPAYGDERERGVFMEACTFGLTIGLYVSLAAGLLLALLGQLLAPAVLVAVGVVPAVAATLYARRRQVDIQALAERATTHSSRVAAVVMFALVLATFAAMGLTMVTGEGLVPGAGFDPRAADGALGGALKGGVVGGFLGALAALVGTMLAKRGRRSDG